MKRLLLTLLILLTSSQAYPLVSYKVSPDYEIQASMITTDKGWKVNIKIRDMLLKKYIKAWASTAVTPEDIDLTGNRDLAVFNHEYGETYDCNIIGESIGTCNYKKAYKAITYSVFKIAMQIQDAGLIPAIKYGNIDQISVDGTMYHSTNIKPTGNYKNFRKIIYIKKYLPDYYIYAGIRPVMSEDNLSVLSWITTFEVSMGRDMTIWTASETNLLNFDLTEPDTHTKSKFIIQSATWLDAQKAMFVQTHLLMSRMIKKNPELLLEVKFEPIEFTSDNNVKLIDLANGIIPDGTMEAYTPNMAASPELISPAGSSIINENPITFSWASSANSTSYKLSYYDSTVYSQNPVITDIFTSSTSAQVTLPILPTVKSYTWHVTGINDEGEGEASLNKVFTTKRPYFQYIRIRNTSQAWGSNYDFGICQIRFYTNQNYSGTEFAHTGIASASSNQTGCDASQAIDTSNISTWLTADNTQFQWIGINQSASTNVLGSFKLYVHGDYSGAAIGKTFVVEASNNADYSESVILGTYSVETNFFTPTWLNFVIQ